MTQATTHKQRFRRKDLREPDEFISLSRRSIDWARHNVLIVEIAAGVLLAVLLIVGGVRWYQQSRADGAARAFYGANELFKREQWDAAQEGFAQLVQDYGSSTYGTMAKLYAGRAALNANKAADAVPFLQQYVAAAPNRALEQLGRVELARALEANGDASGAREQLTKATELEGPAGPQATIALARLMEEAGERDKAVELYQKYLADAPEGASADLARTRLAGLGVAPPPSPPSALSFPPNSGLAMPPFQVQ